MFARRLVPACLVGLLVAGLGTTARADEPSAPTLAVSGPADRGVYGVRITAKNFAPDTEYALTATAGQLSDAGQPVTKLTSDEDGAFTFAYEADSATPLSVHAGEVTVSAGGSSTTVTVPIADPRLAVTDPSRTCPHYPYEPVSASFPDGQYTVASAALTPTSVTVTATGGKLALSGVRWADSLPATSTVTVTEQATTTQLTFPVTRDAPRASGYGWLSAFPWHESIKVSCMRPGEKVTLTPGSRGLVRKTTVVANEVGDAYFLVSHRPTAAPSDAPGIDFRGTTSGQEGTTAAVGTFGTTLRVGQTLNKSNRGLLSADGRWTVSDRLCDLVIEGGDGFDVDQRTWHAHPVKTTRDDCYARVQSDGNFVFRRGDGSVVWQSRTAGTGSNNHLGMRNDGVLVLYTSAGKAVWSSRTGLIRTASAMGMGQYLRKGQSLVYGSTRLTMRSNGDLAVLRSGRVRWSSHTAGRGSFAVLQHDGQFVVRNSANHNVWTSRKTTAGFTAQVWVYHTGDVVVRDQIGERLWHSATG